ncbi:ATP-binding protein [Desulfosporosinus sp. PR]|uniref:sensor histidine kinase n=1 Tax=Candidatus Desulfosporosinus nitrosoreducens TaxID=3401928 RepID=UPI0027F71D53|nr:ATP-binding protein [Desulfosporosinus sp. PR]MDQ7094638.1 ATP-binding protein [Desulfosporosinus sp. PR]
MRLRTHLLTANGSSIAFILICLSISYYKMLLSLDQIVFLTFVALIAGVISFFVHVIMTRPIEKAIGLITFESAEIAAGDFKGKVPLIGPLEFRQLALQFNEMSGKLNESFTKLQQSETSRRELVANISHDLRTPLASIQSFVEALQDDIVKDKETFERYLNTIRLETKRLGVLIEDLFQLSRMELGTEIVHLQPYFLDDLIIETLENYQLRLDDSKCEVSVDIPEKMKKVYIDPDKLKRVFINLIENALRYSPAGGLIKITVQDQEPEYCKVVITDQGEGISGNELSHIFDRFYRVEKSRDRQYGGTGLGLAIAKSIVELHGGQIGVESTVGIGSSFWFTLPKHNLLEKIN